MLNERLGATHAGRSGLQGTGYDLITNYKDLSPFLDGRVSVYNGKKLVLSCPVEKKEKDGELRFRFQVASEDVGKVRFDFTEYAFAKSVDGQGRVKIQPMPAMDRYSLELKDFDYIDIGAILDTSGAVAVVIKSLVFPTSAGVGGECAVTPIAAGADAAS